jgi:hypothetical protein
MNLRIRYLCVLTLSASIASAQTKSPTQEKSQPPVKNAEASEAASSPSTDGKSKLPVRRVVLYKNGVGYFEHLGQVHGSQDVHIDFTSAQLTS